MKTDQDHDKDQDHESTNGSGGTVTNDAAGANNRVPEIADSGGKSRAERSLETLEDEAYRRVVAGVEKPIFQHGKQVGVVRQRSDRLLVFMLATLNPAKYGRGKGKAEEPKLVNHPFYGSFNTHPDMVREYERDAEIMRPINDHWERWFKEQNELKAGIQSTAPDGRMGE